MTATRSARGPATGPGTRWRVLVVAGALTCVLGLAGCAGAQPPAAGGPGGPDEPDATTEATAPAGRTDDVSRGRELFGQSCASCHGQQGTGSQFGPSLVGVGAMSADFWLSTGRMPLEQPSDEPEHSDPAFGPHDTEALVDYVASLGDGPAIPTVREGDLQHGRELYLGTCATCHSASVVGGALPEGEEAPPLIPSTPTQIAEAIRLGPGAMPPYPEHALSDDEVNALASYIVTLRDTDDHGGHPLGAYGPATEGIVGWVFGVGVLLVVIRLLGKRSR